MIPDSVLAGQIKNIDHIRQWLTYLCGRTIGLRRNPDLAVNPDWVKYSREQRTHLLEHVKQPPNPDLPEIELAIGHRIDRELLRICDLIDLANSIPQGRALARQRRQLQKQEETRIAERRKQRRKRLEQVERQLASAPAHEEARPKREKLPPRPQCEKCGHRPQKVGRFCVQCAAWEGHG
jgi:hypothetical protein